MHVEVRRFAGSIGPCWAFLILLLPASGCVTPGYQDASLSTSGVEHASFTDESQIERGRPHTLIDGVGWVVGIPSKIMLWNADVDSHFVSPHTELAIHDYLARNRLDDVKVRLNQYDPAGEWRRLKENKAVAPGWRYTLGAVATLGYTILPGRILGGDNYNPFTNTISLYSDHPAIALHEGGHAKDFARRKYRGTYAAAYLVPGLALVHETRATNDALSYVHAHGEAAEMRDAYRVLYPAFGSHVAGQINHFVPPPFDLAVTAACVIPGHIAGRHQAAGVDDEDFARRDAAIELNSSPIQQAEHLVR